MSSPEPRMSKVQLGMVKTALQIAFEDGVNFASMDAIDDYLKEAGVSRDLLSKHSREVFNYYLQLKHQLEAPPSPPPSESQGKASNISLEREDLLDQGDNVPPIFESDETFVISFFRPRRNDFYILQAKNCKGNVSYISEKIARKHHLNSGRQNIILCWRYTGGPQSNESLTTRCEVVKPELLPGCDIAFGEECGKQDSEESEEEEDEDDDDDEEEDTEEDPRSPGKSPFNNMVLYRRIETIKIHELSPEQESRVLRKTAEMNLESALSMEKQKIAQSPPTPFRLPPCPPAPQRTTQGKRSRRS